MFAFLASLLFRGVAGRGSRKKHAVLRHAWVYAAIVLPHFVWRYFYYGHPQRSMVQINHFAEERLRKWLMRKRQRRGPGYAQYPTAAIYESYGLHRLPTRRPGAPAHASG